MSQRAPLEECSNLSGLYPVSFLPIPTLAEVKTGHFNQKGKLGRIQKRRMLSGLVGSIVSTPDYKAERVSSMRGTESKEKNP